MMNSKKYSLVLLLIIVSFLTGNSQSLVENLEVEVYYISTSVDAFENEDIDILEAGSTTYRIFVDLAEGVKLRAIYGDINHPFRIYSDENFFNHSDRGDTWGYGINDNSIDENTTVLDSYLTFGAATDNHWGIPKNLDTDGSIVGGANNDEGILINDVAEMGIPLTEQDGLFESLDGTESNQFQNPIGLAQEVFGEVTQSNLFEYSNWNVQIDDPLNLDTLDNRILIAQLTTAGDSLDFCINLELVNIEGDIVKYVATNDTLLPGEFFSPFLKYPPQCGCTDPDFLEYNPAALCDDGSCSTPIIFGCADTLACNYDPEVNFNVQELCCILPNDCDNLDPDLLCPGFVYIDEPEWVNTLSYFPNPVDNILTLSLFESFDENLNLSLLDLNGRIVLTSVFPSNTLEHQLRLDSLESGNYILRINSQNGTRTIRIMKF